MASLRKVRLLNFLQIILASVLLSASGCIYVSDYVPPSDGRARVIWRGDRIVPFLAGGRLETDACASAVANLARVKRVSFYGHDVLPRRAGKYYLDWITEKRNDFFSPSLVIRIRPKPESENKFWTPIYYSFLGKIKPDFFEFGWRPVFDYQIWRNAPLRQEAALPPDELDTNQFFTQQGARHALGWIEMDTFGYRDNFPAAVLRVGVNTVMAVLTPFFGITSIFPAAVSPGSFVGINYASNLVNTFNDLARTENTPCSYARP